MNTHAKKVNESLESVLRDHITDEIVAASRDESNWAWDDNESSAGGADVRDPNAETGSMWCGTLTVPSLGIDIPYGFCVHWTGSQTEVSFDSGCRDGDVGTITGTDPIMDCIDIRDIAWSCGNDISTPGLQAAVRAVCEEEIIRHSADGSISMVWSDGKPLRCPTQHDMDTLPVGDDMSDDEIESLD